MTDYDAAMAQSMEAYERLTKKLAAAQARQDLEAERARRAWALSSADVAFLRACGIQP